MVSTAPASLTCQAKDNFVICAITYIVVTDTNDLDLKLSESFLHLPLVQLEAKNQLEAKI